MLPLKVVFDVPPEIAHGLATGALERVGGVIRETGSKQIVMWLREGARIASNPDIAGGVLKSLLNVASGGWASLAAEGINAMVAANRHKVIMQQLSVIQGIATVGAAGSVIGIAVQIASTLYLVRNINEIHDIIVTEFERDRQIRLQAAVEYAESILPHLKDESRQAGVELASRDFIAARKDILWKLDQILDSRQLTVEQIELASRLLLQAIQLDSAHIRMQLEIGRIDLAKAQLDRRLEEYRKLTRALIQNLLGDYRARYFNSKVADNDFLRFVLVEEWLREEKDIILDLVLEQRKYFWDRNVSQRLGPNKGDIRRFTHLGHLEALSYIESLIENYGRLVGYRAEIEAVERLGLTFSEWEEQIAERLADQDIDIAEHNDYVLLVDNERLAQQSDSTAA
ncbi:MAG: hypothetical protein OXE95_01425 [Chloroflexi bacterium]|nr:hypothetical protein [Chloroflexota bacterium]MCY4246220.1 hypothetical protein [Chloroflexota bacterium]